MDPPRWFPDELPLAGAEHLDPAYAAGFDRKTGGGAEEEVEVLVEFGLGQDSTLVDLGAGTGTLALLAAAHCRRVVAVEPSDAMLQVLHKRLRAAPNDRLEVVQAGFLTYDHMGLPADVVYSRNALHHLPDFWKTVALGRIRAILRPGGLLVLRDVVYSFEPHEAEQTFERWFAEAPRDPADGWTQTDLEEHVRDEHSTFTWLLEPMLEHAGFEILERDYRPQRTYAGYVCRVA
jgi:SAM-dependent methyltransferase